MLWLFKSMIISPLKFLGYKVVYHYMCITSRVITCIVINSDKLPFLHYDTVYCVLAVFTDKQHLTIQLQHHCINVNTSIYHDTGYIDTT